MLNKIKSIKKNSVIIMKKKTFKLKKKWRFWRGFRQHFINKKKITFYKKLQWNFDEKRLIWHQLIKSYLPKIKNFLLKKQASSQKYVFFIRKLELRLAIVLLRAKFYYKLINSYNGIKNNLILINGIFINKIYFLLKIQDLFQKRRTKNSFIKKKNEKYKRIIRLKWRKYRWKKARFIYWKVRRTSHFNMYWSRKQNSFLNYLEINYKIPAGIIIKQPFLKELLINKEPNILNNNIIKKIFFLY